MSYGCSFKIYFSKRSGILGFFASLVSALLLLLSTTPHHPSLGFFFLLLMRFPIPTNKKKCNVSFQ